MLFGEVYDRGDERSAIYLGWLLKEGLGVEQNFVLARKYLVQAAAAGNVNALGYLAKIAEAEGSPEETEAAYKRAAAKGHLPSLYNLGYLFAEGGLLPRNVEAARDNLSAAVARGHVFAERSLATLYWSGCFGHFGRLLGLWYFLHGAINLVRFAAANPDDDRLSS